VSKTLAFFISNVWSEWARLLVQDIFLIFKELAGTNNLAYYKAASVMKKVLKQ
jgi:hypothetical protein